MITKEYMGNNDITYYKISFAQNKVTAEVATFGNGKESTMESHVVFHVKKDSGNFENQLSLLFSAFQEMKSYLNNSQTLFRRYFLSDAANQTKFLKQKETEFGIGGTCSIIQQAPLDGSKIALWAYFASKMEKSDINEVSAFSHNGYKHIWRSEKGLPEGDSFIQTEKLLQAETDFLTHLGMNMEKNCLRTWFYVQNIDVNYQGMVEARKKLFMEYGLNAETHYITSTGIEGRSEYFRSKVRLDSYYIDGLKKNQIQYLYAKTHLNPTYEYGVTFERGVKIAYGDRNHILLSGTASIDNKGTILHEGDIEKQTDRMLENCEALLNEGGSTLHDLVHILIYIRDIADYEIVLQKFESRCPDIPKVILLAPVCRPGWLIEMECMSIVKQKNEDFKPY